MHKQYLCFCWCCPEAVPDGILPLRAACHHLQRLQPRNAAQQLTDKADFLCSHHHHEIIYQGGAGKLQQRMHQYGLPCQFQENLVHAGLHPPPCPRSRKHHCYHFSLPLAYLKNLSSFIILHLSEKSNFNREQSSLFFTTKKGAAKKVTNQQSTSSQPQEFLCFIFSAWRKSCVRPPSATPT